MQIFVCAQHHSKPKLPGINDFMKSFLLEGENEEIFPINILLVFTRKCLKYQSTFFLLGSGFNVFFPQKEKNERLLLIYKRNAGSFFLVLYSPRFLAGFLKKICQLKWGKVVNLGL